ncbi:MAG: hypothetical protein SGJ18_05425 [Pseudomonadota bacterium]|nr:hypothetical protein [Pseudomonadota bacterium]
MIVLKTEQKILMKNLLLIADIKHKYRPKFPYTNEFVATLVTGQRVYFHTNNKVKAPYTVIDFNPNGFSSFRASELLTNAVVDDFDEPKILREHLNIDLVGTEYNTVKAEIYTPRTRRGMRVRGFSRTDGRYRLTTSLEFGSVTESLYLGSPTRTEVVVYDAHHWHQSKCPENPTTRIELRLNESKIGVRFSEASQYWKIRDPFRRIKFYGFDVSAAKPSQRKDILLFQILSNVCGQKEAEAQLRRIDGSNFYRMKKVIEKYRISTNYDLGGKFQKRLDKFLSAPLSVGESKMFNRVPGLIRKRGLK